MTVPKDMPAPQGSEPHPQCRNRFGAHKHTAHSLGTEMQRIKHYPQNVREKQATTASLKFATIILPIPHIHSIKKQIARNHEEQRHSKTGERTRKRHPQQRKERILSPRISRNARGTQRRVAKAMDEHHRHSQREAKPVESCDRSLGGHLKRGTKGLIGSIRPMSGRDAIFSRISGHRRLFR